MSHMATQNLLPFLRSRGWLAGREDHEGVGLRPSWET